jgi:hypothetical protein
MAQGTGVHFCKFALKTDSLGGENMAVYKWNGSKSIK